MNGWMKKLKVITLKVGNGLIMEVHVRKKVWNSQFSSRSFIHRGCHQLGILPNLNNGHYFTVRIVLVRNVRKIMKVKLWPFGFKSIIIFFILLDMYVTFNYFNAINSSLSQSECLCQMLRVFKMHSWNDTFKKNRKQWVQHGLSPEGMEEK